MAEHDQANNRAMPKHGEFCWSEFAVSDLKACLPFYQNVFGWTFERSTSSGDEMEYLEFSSCGGEQKDAAIYEMNATMFGDEMPPPHIAQYVAVDDVEQTAEKAKALGGSVLFGPYDIPNVGRMAVINDPSGASISVITLTGGN